MTLNARLITSSFNQLPSQSPGRTVGFLFPQKLGSDLDAVGIAIGTSGEGARTAGIDFDALRNTGFEGKPGQYLLIPQGTGATVIAMGVGEANTQTAAALRDVAAGFARATSRYARIGIDLGDSFRLAPETVGQMLAEGILLARYTYTELQSTPSDIALVSVDVAVPEGQTEAVARGVHVGETTARATNIARDLANSPPAHLTAPRFGDVATEIGPGYGLEVEVFGLQQLIDLGCGGLLGVNAGGAEEPRMIKLSYRPDNPTGAVALVGKGITYDAGGISLKPSDAMHLLMKMDMAGAAAVLASMTALRALGCTTTVTGYLMCTDNMPSGTAMGLGDVLRIHGGKTIEIKNTDAEGRLVMADALALAAEQHPDAIIDIATLTGSSLQALGPRVAAMFGNNGALIDQAVRAGENTDESIWLLPLEHRYREQLNSTIADMSNMGGPFNVAITAALFLHEFVGDIPWVHFDIAGTMQSDRDDSWRSSGATGFGTRLLIEMLRNFAPVR